VLKHRTVLLTQYAAGLRLSEATYLQVSDIDSSRMQLNIRQGKGSKQRLVPLSPRLLTELREYWKQTRPTGTFLFSGKTPDCRWPTAVQKACKLAATWRIPKHVTPYCAPPQLRDGLLEAGVDLLTISRLLGHSSFLTTMVYLRAATAWIDTKPAGLVAGPAVPAVGGSDAAVAAERVRQPGILVASDAAPGSGARGSRPTLRVIDLLRQYTQGFLERHGNQAPPQVQNVLAKLAMCRTLALGEHVYECPQCQHRSHVYNSCLDRHCPLCSVDWLARRPSCCYPRSTRSCLRFRVWGLMLGNANTCPCCSRRLGQPWRAAAGSLGL
jgi:hypothetical protein